MSTLQSTVAGKADAGTEITGGAFSDNVLTLTKADGSSIGVDIPLPESSQIDTIEIEGGITIFFDIETINLNTYLSNPRNVYVPNNISIDREYTYYSSYSKSKVKNIASRTDIYVLQSYTRSYLSDNTQITVKIIDEIKKINLIDGKYKFRLDSLVNGINQDYQYNQRIDASEEIYVGFTVENNNITFDKTEFIINSNNFRSSYAGNITLNKIKICIDSVVKVNDI